MKIDFEKILDEVFEFKIGEKVAVIYDIPKDKDNKEWQDRRAIAQIWQIELSKITDTELAYFMATKSHNADLPEDCIVGEKRVPFSDFISEKDIVFALTEYSTTAPLFNYAKKYGIRAASMPQFNKEMIPALELDFGDIAEKVHKIYSILEKSDEADIIFSVKDKEYKLHFDLQNRKPKKDDGFCPKGHVINLPTGEAFIVPFEGKESKTHGELPIETDKVRVYKVKNNNIVSGSGELVERIKQDPAVGNIAELAFGVLGLYGIKSSGKILLDEKLGLHIALGRSEHLGGETSPKEFKKEENVWHQDFVYTKEMQPNVKIKEVKLAGKVIMKYNKYTIFD